MRINSVLVVCVGNICRSPTAERLLRQALPNKQIRSAGIGALVGKPADATACEVAEAHALSLDGHAATQLTAELGQQHDLILVMERRHIESVCRIAPALRGKVMLISQWSGGHDIPDPYRQGREAFEHAYKLLATACASWTRYLE